MVRIKVMALLVTTTVVIPLIVWDIFGPVQVQPQRTVLNFHMQFTAVYYSLVYGDAFLIPLDKCNLDVWAYYDFMKMTYRSGLSIGDTRYKHKHACSQNGY